MDKVLIYAMSVNIGGVEEYVLNLSRYNTDRVCEYEYIIDGSSTPYKDEMNELGVTYHFLPSKKELTDNIRELNRLFRIKRKECDTIYFNTSGIYYPIPYILAKKYNYRIIIHSHLAGSSGILIFIHKLNRAWIMGSCDRMLACSTPAAEWMFGKKNLNKIKIIPNAINLERFKYDDTLRRKLRAKYQLDDYFVVGHVGRLTHVKNQKFLINMLAEAVNQGLSYKLLLVGDGEDKQMLWQEAESLNVLDKIIFYGKSDRPEDLLNCMDCFVMPSLVEGFPITLVEAQANGLPCVVSNTVTNEVNVSGYIKFLSIEEKKKLWIENINHMCHRYQCADLLKQKGYDVKEIESRVRKELLVSG